MTDAFRQSELLERLTPYVVPVEARAPHAVVSEWVAQALDKVFTSDSAAVRLPLQRLFSNSQRVSAIFCGDGRSRVRRHRA